MTQLSTQDITEAIEKNQHAYLADYGRCSLINLYQTGELVWFISRMPQSRFNRIIHARFSDHDAIPKVRETLTYFISQKIPLLWHTGPSSRPYNLNKLLIENGMTKVREEAGMALIPDEINSSPRPRGLEIKPVNSDSMINDWSHVFTRSYNMDQSAIDLFCQVESELAGPAYRRLYIGYYNDEAVSTGTLFLTGNIAGIYAIGTLPFARGRGFGRAITEFLISEARHDNISLYTLHASPMGLGIYQKIGFRRYCMLRAFSLNFNDS